MTVVGVAFLFNYINGFHDPANAIATVVSTSVLPPRTAIILAAFFNFIGAFAGTGVAKTIGADIVDPKSITQAVVVCALLGAIVWNLITWYFGIPSSSSHALVGGIVGSVLAARAQDAHAGFGQTLHALLSSDGVTKVLKGLVLSPLAGMVMGFFIMIGLLWAVRRSAPSTVNRSF